MIDLPPGFVLVEQVVESGADRHALGRTLAQNALDTLGGGTLAYDGTRPIVVDGDAAVSITHSRTRVLAIAARTSRLGIDIVDDLDADRLERLADRYLDDERSLAITPQTRAACFAAKEAGLKALGLGLLDGGMFDKCAIRVVSLDPPQLASDSGLALHIGRTDGATLAVAYA